jgi:glyoxylase-like metal-dependent hydrolase (beta-lactamase superfamily II)
MRIHHLDCGAMCPLGGRLFDGYSSGPTAHLSCHCLLIESDQGLVLVDTGFGLRDVRVPRPRLPGLFLRLNRIRLKEELTAIRQIERLGFSAGDVRHIVLTHLDFDHAGGLDDFPQAAVHLLAPELDSARNDRDGFISRRRYRPQQWEGVTDWRTYGVGGEPWFGFDCVRDLKGLPPDILMIPLAGHTRGHAGVAIRTGGGWLLHAGDAYFFRGEMNPNRPRCPPGADAYQRMMEVDRRARLANQGRLRGLAARHGSEVRLFCSHDRSEFRDLAAAGAP